MYLTPSPKTEFLFSEDYEGNTLPGVRCPSVRCPTLLTFSVADPDPGWVKKQDSDPGPGSGMNNPDHISESLGTNFLG